MVVKEGERTLQEPFLVHTSVWAVLGCWGG